MPMRLPHPTPPTRSSGLRRFPAAYASAIPSRSRGSLDRSESGTYTVNDFIARAESGAQEALTWLGSLCIRRVPE
jgi:hypothetical protein